MLTLPKIEERPERHTVGITADVSMDGIPKFADSKFAALFRWLSDRGIEPTGPAFFRYHVIDMSGNLRLEAGVPVDKPIEADGEVQTGTLPAGQYATVTWIGPYDDLMAVNAVLIGWAKETGIKWDCTEEPDGEHFACRLEVYETDPMDEPDSQKWVTEVTIKVAN